MVWVALVFSITLHAGIIKARFIDPLVDAVKSSRQLDVTLVNSKHDKRPIDPDILAQANLDGGGKSEKDDRLSSPLPVTAVDQTGDSLQQTVKRSQVLEQETQNLLNQLKTSTFHVQRQPHQADPNTPDDGSEGSDELDQKKSLSSQEAELLDRVRLQQKKPFPTLISARTAELKYALYYHAWKSAVERVGDLNYPEAATREGKYGSLKILITILPDGRLAELAKDQGVEILKASPYKVLDEAARKIVRRSAPFTPPPPDMLAGRNSIAILWTMTFTKNNTLTSQVTD